MRGSVVAAVAAGVAVLVVVAVAFVAAHFAAADREGLGWGCEAVEAGMIGNGLGKVGCSPFGNRFALAPVQIGEVGTLERPWDEVDGRRGSSVGDHMRGVEGAACGA